MQMGLTLERGGSISLSQSMIRRHEKTLIMPLPRRDLCPAAAAAAAPSTTKTPENKSESSKMLQCQDNWFHRLAIHHLSSSIRATTGVKKSEGEGYDGLVEAAAVVARRHGAGEQRDIVVEALKKAFPEAVMAMLRILLPQSTFTREFFAVFTTIFFSWLVGPCEVRESDFQGKREKNVVYIPKCRFLEATSCVGMCTNLCKLPSQKFINDSLGMPTNMVPNFEDKSCEMIFGQHPLADDPALKQPCFRTSCIAKQTHGVGCSS